MPTANTTPTTTEVVNEIVSFMNNANNKIDVKYVSCYDVTSSYIKAKVTFPAIFRKCMNLFIIPSDEGTKEYRIYLPSRSESSAYLIERGQRHLLKRIFMNTCINDNERFYEFFNTEKVNDLDFEFYFNEMNECMSFKSSLSTMLRNLVKIISDTLSEYQTTFSISIERR